MLFATLPVKIAGDLVRNVPVLTPFIYTAARRRGWCRGKLMQCQVMQRARPRANRRLKHEVIIQENAKILKKTSPRLESPIPAP